MTNNDLVPPSRFSQHKVGIQDRPRTLKIPKKKKKKILTTNKKSGTNKHGGEWKPKIRKVAVAKAGSSVADINDRTITARFVSVAQWTSTARN